MMEKTLFKRSFIRFSRALAGVALVAAAVGAVSCEEHSNSERREAIEVYTDPAEKESVDAVYADVRGGQMQIYVDANVDFKATWQDDLATPWGRVLSYTEVDPQSGYRVVTLKFGRRSAANVSYYTRRTGMLLLSATDGSLNYNRIIPVHQGSIARVSNDFSSMKYGKEDPRFTEGETSIDNWTAAQKKYGFSSTKIEGEPMAYCFGKNGYLKLGDEQGHGADLISPLTATLRGDSLLMVSFRAVAYTDFNTGVKDDNKISVEILGGGVLRDEAEQGTTKIDLEVPYYDMASPDFPDDMWEGGDFLIFVQETEDNPITVNTQIRISCGSLGTPAATNSRIFLDNFYIRCLTLDEQNYFEQNPGSGKDNILGKLVEDEPEL